MKLDGKFLGSSWKRDHTCPWCNLEYAGHAIYLCNQWGRLKGLLGWLLVILITYIVFLITGNGGVAGTIGFIAFMAWKA